jgi:GNAT superfamily N-acetyltransferase
MRRLKCQTGSGKLAPSLPLHGQESATAGRGHARGGFFSTPYEGVEEMTKDLRIARLQGADLASYIPALARLRIEVFRDFPYLYDGDMDYEAGYLRTYIDAPGSVMVLVFDGDRVVGASTAVPLRHETPPVQQPFIEQGMNPQDIFYLGESVLQRAYRGRGLGVRFFAEREAHAAEVGEFRYAAFCAVDRPADHPRRPPDYVPLDAFWRKRGYARQPQLRTQFTWRDLHETEQTAKPMTFWMKPLSSDRR